MGTTNTISRSQTPPWVTTSTLRRTQPETCLPYKGYVSVGPAFDARTALSDIASKVEADYGSKTIRELIRDLRRIDKTIARLEKSPPISRPRSTRGRKSMPPEERREVSKRMTAYWEKRRSLNDADKNCND